MACIEDPVLSRKSGTICAENATPASPEPDKPADKPRRRGGQDSRAKLLVAARALFVEHGYHDTRPQDVSRAAGVGHGTFYLHFPDKRACFFAFAEEACAELDRAVERALDGVEDIGERIECVLAAVVDYHLSHPGVLRAALSNPNVIGTGEDHRAAILGRWARSWSARLTWGAESGQVHRDYDFDIIGWTIVGMFNPICTANIANRANREHVIANMKRLLVRGLLAGGGAST